LSELLLILTLLWFYFSVLYYIFICTCRT